MRRRWIIIFLVTVLSLTAVSLTVYWRHTVPFNQCSEVYQRYSRFPGVEAAFIRDKQINDTLSLDMTLLVAKDSSTFAGLLNEWGKSDEYIMSVMNTEKDETLRLVGLRRKGHPEQPADIDDSNNEVMVIFPVRKKIAFFHPTHPSQINILLLGNLHTNINIKET